MSSRCQVSIRSDGNTDGWWRGLGIDKLVPVVGILVVIDSDIHTYRKSKYRATERAVILDQLLDT